MTKQISLPSHLHCDNSKTMKRITHLFYWKLLLLQCVEWRFLTNISGASSSFTSLWKNWANYITRCLNIPQSALLEHGFVIQYKKGSNMPRLPASDDTITTVSHIGAFNPFQSNLKELQTQDETLQILPNASKSRIWTDSANVFIWNPRILENFAELGGFSSNELSINM
jgi:hypothetical protein